MSPSGYTAGEIARSGCTREELERADELIFLVTEACGLDYPGEYGTMSDTVRLVEALREVGTNDLATAHGRIVALEAAARRMVSVYMAGEDLAPAVRALEDLTGGQQTGS